MTNVGTPPSVCAINAGPLEVWVDTDTTNGMDFLGITANGARITESSLQYQIHDDTAGGDQGPWTDQQLFGQQHQIELDLVRWNDTILSYIEARYNPNNVSPTQGMFLGCTGSLFRVLLYGPNFMRNYESANSAGAGNCYVLDPIRRSPIGTRYSRISLTFTAYSLSTVVPYDSVTTGRSAPSIPCAVNGGPLQVWVDTGASNAMEFLGWTVNGAEIEETGMLTPIHDDTAGGDQGPPTDFQFMGGEHRISLELIRFQDSVLTKLEKRYNVKQTASVGQFLACGQGLFRVLLRGSNFLRNYSTSTLAGYGNCTLSEPISRSPIGTQASRARLSFVAPYLAGVQPWNSTITTP